MATTAPTDLPAHQSQRDRADAATGVNDHSVLLHLPLDASASQLLRLVAEAEKLVGSPGPDSPRTPPSPPISGIGMLAMSRVFGIDPGTEFISPVDITTRHSRVWIGVPHHTPDSGLIAHKEPLSGWPDRSSRDISEVNARTLWTECAAAALLQHLFPDSPNRPKLLGLSTERTDSTGAVSLLPFIRMEGFPGSWGTRLEARSGPLPGTAREYVEAVRPLLGAARGLAEVHEAGLIHRDIKPGNIFVRSDGTTALGDLGIAITDSRFPRYVYGGLEVPAQEEIGTILGSPRYMSPEHARSDRLHPSTDVFAFGLVLYETLTGVLPYRDAPNLISTLTARSSDTPIPIEDIAPRVPPELARFIGRCLSVDRSHRFPSAREMLPSFEAALSTSE